MSAYVGEAAKRGSPGQSQESQGGMLSQLEDLVTTAKRLETALREERAAKHKLLGEMQSQHLRFDQVLAEERARGNESATRETKFKQALTAYQENEQKTADRIKIAQNELLAAKTELQKYKQAWVNVLEREREAKMIIRESQDRATRLNALDAQLKETGEALLEERKQREQSDRHAKNYQVELQNTLVRLHSAEARFTELSKEFQTLNQAKRNIDGEIKRVEETIRERYRWELIREREKLKTELEKSSHTEREQMREEIRQSVMGDYERRLNLERDRAAKASREQLQEIGRLKAELGATKNQFSQQLQLTHKEVSESSQRFNELSQKMDQLRREASEIRTGLPQAESLEAEASNLKQELGGIEEKYREEIVALQERLLATKERKISPPGAASLDWIPDPRAQQQERKMGVPPPPPAALALSKK